MSSCGTKEPAGNASKHRTHARTFVESRFSVILSTMLEGVSET